MTNTTNLVFSTYEEAAAAAKKMGSRYTVEADFSTKTFAVGVRPSFASDDEWEAFEAMDHGPFVGEDVISVLGA